MSMPAVSPAAAVGSRLFGSGPPVADAAPGAATTTGGALAGDRVSLGARVERGVHLAGSLSMIAMTPLMLAMMLAPRRAKPSNGGGGDATTA